MEDNKLLQAILEKLNEMGDSIEELKDGQKAIKRDVARVERKIDRLSNDVGDTLAIITETADYELSKLREAK